MFENRIGSLGAAPILTASGVVVPPAFVPCPTPLLVMFGPTHPAFVAEVYRRAQELAASQARAPRPRWRMPEFSLN